MSDSKTGHPLRKTRCQGRTASGNQCGMKPGKGRNYCRYCDAGPNGGARASGSISGSGKASRASDGNV